MPKDKCKTCGKKWVDHPGIIPTCKQLQVALDALGQIAGQPRNTLSRKLAVSALILLKN